MPDGDQQPMGFELTLTIAGPNYSDSITLKGEDELELTPSHGEVNGLTYERYIGDTPDEWIEVRFDYIVAREMRAIYEQVMPEPAAPASEQDILAQPAEDRVPHEGEETA